MLISEFARATGLSRDTVRFYVRLGLLQPESTGKGGRNPYQSFNAGQVQAARIIRVAQSLGLSLKDIGAIAAERRAGRMTRDRSVAVLAGQLAILEAKSHELAAMTSYLRAKIDWLAGGETGTAPEFRGNLSAPKPAVASVPETPVTRRGRGDRAPADRSLHGVTAG